VDTVDRKLIEALRTNARASYAELGRLVGLSGPSVTDRVNRLEQSCVISGYHARVDPVAIGYGVTALIGVLLSDSADQDDVARRLRDVREIEDCWFIAGEETFVAKVRTADVISLERLLGRLIGIRGVARTRTTVVLSTKWEQRTPGPADPAPIA
jgi:Lrp/AsnC family transcriptional regulator, leucine-responsive regulatory protein